MLWHDCFEVWCQTANCHAKGLLFKTINFNVFLGLSVLSANYQYLGDNFVYLNWIVELFHYQTKMLMFFNKSLIGSKSVLFHSTKAEVHTQISDCWLQFSFHHNKYARFFFLLFPEIFLIQKQYTCF